MAIPYDPTMTEEAPLLVKDANNEKDRDIT